MSKWQNIDLAQFCGVGKYKMPAIRPVYKLPKVDRFIEFDYCQRVRADRYDRSKIGVHFFEDDYKFERIWENPKRYGEVLSQFGYILGPDFSQYVDFPRAISIYNHYRNNWLVCYWQMRYNMIIIPTVMWGLEDSYEWCFDGYPTNSIVAVSNVGLCKDYEMRGMFEKGYNEMLKRLEPTKILFFTRNFAEMPGNVEYIRWEIHKGDQLDGNRTT